MLINSSGSLLVSRALFYAFQFFTSCSSFSHSLVLNLIDFFRFSSNFLHQIFNYLIRLLQLFVNFLLPEFEFYDLISKLLYTFIRYPQVLFQILILRFNIFEIFKGYLKFLIQLKFYGHTQWCHDLTNKDRPQELKLSRKGLNI